MIVRFHFPGGDGWTRDEMVNAVPREGETVMVAHSSDEGETPYVVQRVVWYLDRGNFDVLVSLRR